MLSQPRWRNSQSGPVSRQRQLAAAGTKGGRAEGRGGGSPAFSAVGGGVRRSGGAAGEETRVTARGHVGRAPRSAPTRGVAVCDTATLPEVTRLTRTEPPSQTADRGRLARGGG